LHVTPPACSWLNALETLSSVLTRRQLKRREFPSIVEPQAEIKGSIAEHDDGSKPFWTNPADHIIDKLNRLDASWHSWFGPNEEVRSFGLLRTARSMITVILATGRMGIIGLIWCSDANGTYPCWSCPILGLPSGARCPV
jgi:hypothetical protein